jgi:glycine hydroxymethyltransferase
MTDASVLAARDPEVADLLARERDREHGTVRMIASENYVSAAVLAARGASVVERYASGRPSARRYPGCEVVDELERLAVSRAVRLFGAEHADVQPTSGSVANLCGYLAVLQPGDAVLIPGPGAGGHPSLGASEHLSSDLFVVTQYGVDPATERVDLDVIAARARANRPRLLVAGASTYPRTIDHEQLAAIAAAVGARLLVDAAHTAGLIAAGVYPDPIPHADLVTMSTHKTLRGPRGGMVLCRRDLADRVERAVSPRVQGGPDVARIAATAVALGEAGSASFRADVQRALRTARALAETLADAGLRVVTGGTDTHMVVIDLASTGLSAADAESLCADVGVLVNGLRLSRGGDGSSGAVEALRLGTAATATLGVEDDEIVLLGRHIAQLLRAPADEQVRRRVRAAASELARHPRLTDGYER